MLAVGLNEFQYRNLPCPLPWNAVDFKDLPCPPGKPGGDGQKWQDVSLCSPKPENSPVSLKSERVSNSLLQALRPQQISEP